MSGSYSSLARQAAPPCARPSLLRLSAYKNHEIEVLVLREVGGKNNKKKIEIKLDDFRGTMKSLCKGKKNKVGANNLKRVIKFRRV